MMRIMFPGVAMSRRNVFATIFGACLFGQACFGQQQVYFKQTPAADPVQWMAGPVKANLAEFADINIPEGYRFLGQGNARTYLERMNNPVPGNLVGILAPVSEQWFAVLEFSDIGYVKDSDAGQLDPGAMLNSLRRAVSQQGQAESAAGAPASVSLEWQLKPVYDPAQNKLEWAVRAGSQGEVAVNHSLRLLGRRGVLDIVAVEPYATNLDLAPLREIAKGISFRAGERYSDYQLGDKLAPAGLAELATGITRPNANAASAASQAVGAQQSSVQAKNKTLWAGIGAGVVGVSGIAFVAVIRRKGRRSKRVPQPARKASTVQSGTATSASHQQSPNGTSLVAHTNGHTVNGKASKQNGRKRKKHFSYGAFYSDMVMSLTRGSYEGAFSFTGEYPNKLNGAAVRPGNGNGNEAAADAARAALAAETSKLIESQQKLIDQYRRLIDEQNKLIEEKTKLIDVESRVLEKQTELLEEQQLL